MDKNELYLRGDFLIYLALALVHDRYKANMVDDGGVICSLIDCFTTSPEGLKGLVRVCQCDDIHFHNSLQVVQVASVFSCNEKPKFPGTPAAIVYAKFALPNIHTTTIGGSIVQTTYTNSMGDLLVSRLPCIFL